MPPFRREAGEAAEALAERAARAFTKVFEEFDPDNFRLILRRDGGADVEVKDYAPKDPASSFMRGFWMVWGNVSFRATGGITITHYLAEDGKTLVPRLGAVGLSSFSVIRSSDIEGAAPLNNEHARSDRAPLVLSLIFPSGSSAYCREGGLGLSIFDTIERRRWTWIRLDTPVAATAGQNSAPAGPSGTATPGGTATAPPSGAGPAEGTGGIPPDAPAAAASGLPGWRDNALSPEERERRAAEEKSKSAQRETEAEAERQRLNDARRAREDWGRERPPQTRVVPLAYSHYRLGIHFATYQSVFTISGTSDAHMIDAWIAATLPGMLLWQQEIAGRYWSADVDARQVAREWEKRLYNASGGQLVSVQPMVQHPGGLLP